LKVIDDVERVLNFILGKEVNKHVERTSKERLDRIPRLYETENVPLKDKLIYLHFFIGGCDWYIAEYDGEDLFWDTPF